jgi:hypothetical protein
MMKGKAEAKYSEISKKGNHAKSATYHRMGQLTACHSDKRKQMVEKDFSPPDKLLGSLSEALPS